MDYTIISVLQDKMQHYSFSSIVIESILHDGPNELFIIIFFFFLNPITKKTPYFNSKPVRILFSFIVTRT